MKTRVAAAMLTLITLAALVAVAGCGRQPTEPLASARPGPTTGSGDDDSIPPPPPPPPPPAPIVPIAFAGSDSTLAGTNGALRWVVGNESSAPFRVDYTLTCQLAWPGFPINGSITVAGEDTVSLATPVAVPADAATGMVEFRMTVTRPNGPPASADGWLRVFSNAPPPPPPPPPISPLVYLGADSVQAGGTVTQQWQLTNESASPFTMQWTLESHPNWPGLPKSGSVSLAGNEVHQLTTTAAVPDTAASGYRWLRLTVTRPNGLPNASADGGFLIQP